MRSESVLVTALRDAGVQLLCACPHQYVCQRLTMYFMAANEAVFTKTMSKIRAHGHNLNINMLLSTTITEK